MGKEIERKFKVLPGRDFSMYKSKSIQQGYVNTSICMVYLRILEDGSKGEVILHDKMDNQVLELNISVDDTKEIIDKLCNSSCEKGWYYIQFEHVATRIRTYGTKAYLTFKKDVSGFTRLEYEYEIPCGKASSLISRICSTSLFKRRYLVPVEGHTWEVDVFEQRLEGLVIAEIELKSEDEVFTIPSWVGEELTGDSRYNNINLCSVENK